MLGDELVALLDLNLRQPLFSFLTVLTGLSLSFLT